MPASIQYAYKCGSTLHLQSRGVLRHEAYFALWPPALIAREGGSISVE